MAAGLTTTEAAGGQGAAAAGAAPAVPPRRNRLGPRRLGSGPDHHEDAEESMRKPAPLPLRYHRLHVPSCPARAPADGQRTDWAVVGDLAAGGALCRAGWFFSSMAFLA